MSDDTDQQPACPHDDTTPTLERLHGKIMLCRCNACGSLRGEDGVWESRA